MALVLPQNAPVRLTVHDVQSRVVDVLADGWFAAGRHSIDWSSAADPGLYFIRMSVPGRSIVRRFVLTR